MGYRRVFPLCPDLLRVGSKPVTRVVSGGYHIHNVTPLRARQKRFVQPFFGPAKKKQNGDIHWLKIWLAGVRPAEVVRRSQIWCRGRGPLRAIATDAAR